MTPAELRALLKFCGLSQRAAAQALDIDERTMRRYCAGSAKIPQVVELAVKAVAHDFTEKPCKP